MSVVVPTGVADDEGNFLYINADGRRVEQLDATTGDLVRSASLLGEPIAVDADRLLLYRAPDSSTGGLLSLVKAEGGQFEHRWDQPLLDPALYAQLAGGLDTVDIGAHFEQEQIVVTVNLRHRYRGGAPPPDSVVDEMSYDLDIEQRRDSGTGSIVSLATARHEAGAGGGSMAGPSPASPSDTARGQWTVTVNGGEQRTFELDPGTEAVAVVAERLIYLVVEANTQRTTLRRSLRARSITDLAAPNPQWTRVLGEVALTAPPPPPP